MAIVPSTAGTAIPRARTRCHDYAITRCSSPRPSRGCKPQRRQAPTSKAGDMTFVEEHGGSLRASEAQREKATLCVSEPLWRSSAITVDPIVVAVFLLVY